MAKRAKSPKWSCRSSTKPVLKAALEEGIHLIKPNLRELRDLMDERLVSKEEWISASRRLIAAHGVERVALTLKVSAAPCSSRVTKPGSPKDCR